MSIQLFCNVTHCRRLVIFRRSDRTHCLHFQFSKKLPLTPEPLKMETIHSFETPGKTNSESLRYIPEELNLHIIYDNREETALKNFQGDKIFRESRTK